MQASFPEAREKKAGRRKKEGREVVFFGYMLDISGMEESEGKIQIGRVSPIMSFTKKQLFFHLVSGEGAFGGGQETPPGPREKLEPQEPIGFESRETHVASTGALVTWGAGRTWPPHLVWCLADPVAPGREKVLRRQGQRRVNVGNLHTGFPNLSTATDWL